MADPCLHERDWQRLEQVVERHERELRGMDTTGAETKVYMKQVLESQAEMKTSLKEIQDKLNAAPPATPPTPISQDTQMSLLQRMLPQLLDLLKWAVIIIGALVGVESLLK
jgi:hypothetical protein